MNPLTRSIDGVTKRPKAGRWIKVNVNGTYTYSLWLPVTAPIVRKRGSK